MNSFLRDPNEAPILDPLWKVEQKNWGTRRSRGGLMPRAQTRTTLFDNPTLSPKPQAPNPKQKTKVNRNPGLSG